ncbi:MAG: VTT domain-containing protein [Pseudomonadota bacterium]
MGLFHDRHDTEKKTYVMMEPGWLLYLGIFFGPFVQEDAAVIAAATLSEADPAHFPNIFFVILAGLFLSDIWKYWIGRAAHTSSRARAYAEREHIVSFQGKVRRNLFLTLLTARFLPLARVPMYVACGYFKVSYAHFCAYIFVTAFVYCVAIFVFCHALGEVFGDRIEMVVASIGVAAVIVIGLAFWLRKKRSRA